MQTGKLRHRVTIEEPLGTTRDTGGAKKGKDRQGWRPRVKVWAAVEPLNGRELFNAQQVEPVITHRVRLRYIKGITAHMRIKHRKRELNIESVINVDERNRELELLCREAL